MKTNHFKSRLLASLLLAGTFSACLLDKDKEVNTAPPVVVDTTSKIPPVVVKTPLYAFANSAGAFPSQTTYIQVSKGLDFTTMNNSKAIELSGSSTMRTYGQDLFLTRFGDPATMVKYSADTAGTLKENGRLVIPGARTYSTVTFVSATEAYATIVSGASNIIRFNPTTMEKTGEIDMKDLFRKGATDTVNYKMYYLGTVIRDGKLFVSVHYEKKWDAVYDSAFVAVIDLGSNKLDKLISDGRTNGIFGNGEMVSTFALDEAGDIYVQAKAFDTTVVAGKVTQHSGILRIKKGETGFDPDYFFDLKEATGQDCYGLNYFGNGVAFTARIEDPSDPWEFEGPNFKVYRIDLAGRKSLGVVDGLPKINGSSNSIMESFDGKIVYINAAGADEDAVYSYDPETKKVEKKFTMVGQLNGFSKL